MENAYSSERLATLLNCDLWKTLIPQRDNRAASVENVHSTKTMLLWKTLIPSRRCYCGKRSFHRDDVIVENAHSTEAKLLVMLLWKGLILLIIIRKVFVEDAHSTERHVSKIDTLYRLMDFVWTVYEDLQEI